MEQRAALFFCLNKADVTFLTKASDLFPVLILQADMGKTPGRLLTTVPHTWATDPAFTRGALHKLPQQAGENAFQQLLSPRKSLSVNCRHMQALGMKHLFCSPTMTAPAL